MPIDVDARILTNTRLARDYNVIALDAPAIAAAAQPGQFVMVKPAPGTDPLLRRPFSIFEILRDRDGTPTGISILNRKIGVGTTWLYEAGPERRLPCLGPLGRPFSAVDPPAAAFMVAGGVGLAPFLTLAAALRTRRVETTLFYGGRRQQDLFFLERFEQLGARLVLATEDGSRGHHGLISEPFGRALASHPAAASLAIYACGPTGMMRAVADLATREGRRAEVSLEQVMGCGLGGCYSCVVKVRRGDGPPHYVRSCLEGPIFDAKEIVWEELEH